MADVLAYVAGQSLAGVMVVDLTTMAQIHTWRPGVTYDQICITPDGLTLYATRFSAQSVDVITAATGALVVTINLPTGNPGTIAATPDGTQVYVPDNLHSLFVISTASNTITNTVAITPAANDNVSIPRDGSRVYVVSATAPVTGGIVTVVGNTAVPSVIGSITLASFVGGQTTVAISTDGTKGWVTDPSHFKVTPLDLVALTAGTNWTLTTSPTAGGIALTLDHLTLYNGGTSNQLSISSTSLGSETSVLAGVGSAEGLALTADGTTLAMTDRASANLRLLSTATNLVTSTIGLTGNGFGICLFPSALFPPPPTINIPPLFIPRKGLTSYDDSDFMIDWLALERWANSWAPTLLIPNKPGTELQELTENWVQLKIWAQTTARQAMITGGSTKWVPLFVPRKDTLRQIDLTADWVTVQNWANNLR